jgi:hypothetical protein
LPARSGGAYVAFPRTQADADARHDSQRPVLERYTTRNEYVNQIRIAARNLEHDGFLLPDDAAGIIQSAAESPLWRSRAPWQAIGRPAAAGGGPPAGRSRSSPMRGAWLIND